MASAILLLEAAGRGILLAAACALLAFWAVGAGYQLALVLCAALRRAGASPACAAPRRVCIVVPAHDEELLLGEVLARLGGLDYPADSWRVVVIADNCTDRTAQIAREAGAVVLERDDDARRGKGYALEWALPQLLADPARFDAFLIMDADSFLSPNYLAAMCGLLAGGADAIQGRYDVQNVGDTWRTRLMACALALAHHVRPLGRMALGLSDGLKGNGMCFSRSVLERIPWSGESVTEDIEYTLRLVRAGVRVVYTPDAVLLAQMPTTGSQAASQRQRWEGGRYALLPRALRLLGEGVVRRRPVLVDRALELIIPPFVELFAGPVVFLAGCLAWKVAEPRAWAPGAFAAAWAAVLICEVVYLVLGLMVARVPWSVASALFVAPFYVGWKFWVYAVMLAQRGVGGWKRTERHGLGGG